MANVASAAPEHLAKATTPNGSFRGQHVTGSTVESPLTGDARAKFGRKITRQQNNAAQLHRILIRQGQAASAHAATRIAEYYDKLPNMPAESALHGLIDSFHEFIEAFKEAEVEAEVEVEQDDDTIETSDDDGDGAGLGESEEEGADGPREAAKRFLFSQLEQFDSDVSHQFAAFDILREEFEGEVVGSDIRAALDEATQHFERSDIARDVRAGMAAARAANQSAATLETDPAAIRDAYRTLIREQKNIGQLFDALSKFDMLKNMDAVIDTFRSAAGADLRSVGPSVDPRFLQGLLSELGKLKQMQTVLDYTKEFIATTERLLNEGERGAFTAPQVASRLLNFVAKQQVALADALLLLAGLESAHPSGRVVAVNGLLYLHGLIPDAVLRTFASRLEQKVVLLALSDKVVAEEQSEFEDEDEKDAKKPSRGLPSKRRGSRGLVRGRT